VQLRHAWLHSCIYDTLYHSRRNDRDREYECDSGIFYNSLDLFFFGVNKYDVSINILRRYGHKFGGMFIFTYVTAEVRKILHTGKSLKPDTGEDAENIMFSASSPT